MRVRAQAWAKEGVESVDVVAPAFAQDCLETLEEITGLLHETFVHAGGKRYRYIPCLNESDDAMQFYSDLVLQNVLGWPEQRLLRPATLQRLEPTPPATSACVHAARSAVAVAREVGMPALAADVAAIAAAKKKS